MRKLLVSRGEKQGHLQGRKVIYRVTGGHNCHHGTIQIHPRHIHLLKGDRNILLPGVLHRFFQHGIGDIAPHHAIAVFGKRNSRFPRAAADIQNASRHVYGKVRQQLQYIRRKGIRLLVHKAIIHLCKCLIHTHQSYLPC